MTEIRGSTDSVTTIASTNERYYHSEDAWIPHCMRSANRWTAAKLVYRNGKISKPPCNDEGKMHDAMVDSNLKEYDRSRPGFSLDEADNLIVIDQDDAPQTQEHLILRREIYKRLRDVTFTERSVSNLLYDKKEKFHSFGRSSLVTKAIICKPLGIEIYRGKRYVLTTGIGNNKPIAKPETMDELVLWLLKVIDRMNGNVVSVTTAPPKNVAKPIEQVTRKGGEGGGSSEREVQRANNLYRARTQLGILRNQGIHFITDNTSFSWLCVTMNSEEFLMPKDEIIEWCSSQPNFDRSAINRAYSTKRQPWGSGQAESFFGKIGKLLPNKRTVTSVELPKKSPRIGGTYSFDPVADRKIKPPPDVCKGFPPVGEINGLAGKSNVGKTSLIMHYIAKATQKGHKALVWSFDQSYPFLVQYLLAYKAKGGHVRVMDGVHSIQDCIQEIKEFGKGDPLLFVADPFLNLFGRASGEFMVNGKGVEQEFNPDLQMAWVKAFDWFKPFVTKHNLSVLGTLHTAKGNYGHDIPHSSKLLAYLHDASILYRNGSNMRGFGERQLVERLESSSKGARLLYNVKSRGRASLQHYMYELGEEVDPSLLNPEVSFIPCKLDDWKNVTEDTYSYQETPPNDEEIISCITNLTEGSDKQWAGSRLIARSLKLGEDEYIMTKLIGTMRRIENEGKLKSKKSQNGKGISWQLAPSNA